MCVVVEGASSSARSVVSSVPQDSVLGSILFLAYVNYLTDGLACKHDAFADDYKIYLKLLSSCWTGWQDCLAERFG